jgi:hypothetical protein
VINQHERLETHSTAEPPSLSRFPSPHLCHELLGLLHGDFGEAALDENQRAVAFLGLEHERLPPLVDALGGCGRVRVYV